MQPIALFTNIFSLYFLFFLVFSENYFKFWVLDLPVLLRLLLLKRQYTKKDGCRESP